MDIYYAGPYIGPRGLRCIARTWYDSKSFSNSYTALRARLKSKGLEICDSSKDIRGRTLTIIITA